MHVGHYLSRPLSVSRFNSRLHHLASRLRLLLETLGAVFTQGEAFHIDSMPVPVCKRARLALPQSPRQGLLRLLPGEERGLLRLALASHLYPDGRARQL